MVTISLCMIVKDEEAVLERCLSAVTEIVDEIIIVDTGSTDRTKEIAHRFTEKVYDFIWIDDFAAARNYAFSKATKEYILWLDADDVIDESNRQSFLELKQTLPKEVDSVMMEYHISYDSHGRSTYSTMRNRLVKRKKDYKWIGAVHEYLDVQGTVAKSKTAIYHNKLKETTDRNLKIYKKRQAEGKPFIARDWFYYGNELLNHQQYNEAINVYETFLQKEEGWVEDRIAACIQMATCYAHLNNYDEQVKSLYRSFLYDQPRAEVCCRLGEIYLNYYDEVGRASFWYETALALGSPPDIRGILHQPHAWTWLPHMQLAVCYERLERLEEAIEHCQTALQYARGHKRIQLNLDYLKARLAQVSQVEMKDGQLPPLLKQSFYEFIHGRSVDAFDYIYRVLVNEPENVMAESLLSIFLKRLGYDEEANYYKTKVGESNVEQVVEQVPESSEFIMKDFKKEHISKDKLSDIYSINRIGMIAPLCTGDVLEVGCGSGQLTAAIAMHADRTFSVDQDPLKIEHARLEVYKLGLDTCFFQLYDDTGWKLSDNQFDTVVLDHLLQSVVDPATYVKEAIRVCKDGGRIMITVPRGYLRPERNQIRIMTEEVVRKLVTSSSDLSFEVVDLPLKYSIVGYIKVNKVVQDTHKSAQQSFLPPHPVTPLDELEKVTVIVPTYNRAQLLRHSLHSIFQQTYQNLEVIVVNDGSTDQTDEVMKPFLAKVKYIKKENGGLSSAVNRALPKATGTYIWVFADDDIALPKKVELQVRAFQQNREIDLIHTSAIFMKKKKDDVSFTGMWQARHIDPSNQLKEKLKGNMYFSPTVMVKKQALERAGLYDETLRRAQDYDMWLRMSRFVNVKALPIPTVHYEINEHRHNAEIDERTKEGDQTIVRKAREIPLNELFVRNPFTDHDVFIIESLLERALYMAYHQLVDECTLDIQQANQKRKEHGEPLLSLRGAQLIQELNHYFNQMDAPDAMMDMYELIQAVEKQNKL
ncbi:glycosyltransferase [Halalkalibacter sp. AB-rgal2]|uniref:glycosyltransferase n=1 Tax=Halalkalibacter sp. AB-rgal2 TaxID=3242695 RepID=UPI00359D4FC5